MSAIRSSLLLVLFLTSSSCLAGNVNYTEHAIAIFKGYKLPALDIPFMNTGQDIDLDSTGFKMYLSKVTLAPTAPFEMMRNNYFGRPVVGQPGLHKIVGRVKPQEVLLSMNGTASYWRPGTRDKASVNFVADNFSRLPYTQLSIFFTVCFNPSKRQVNEVNITVDTSDFITRNHFKDMEDFGVESLHYFLPKTVSELLTEGLNIHNDHPILSRAIAQHVQQDRRNY